MLFQFAFDSCGVGGETTFSLSLSLRLLLEDLDPWKAIIGGPTGAASLKTVSNAIEHRPGPSARRPRRMDKWIWAHLGRSRGRYNVGSSAPPHRAPNGRLGELWPGRSVVVKTNSRRDHRPVGRKESGQQFEYAPRRSTGRPINSN